MAKEEVTLRDWDDRVARVLGAEPKPGQAPRYTRDLNLAIVALEAWQERDGDRVVRIERGPEGGWAVSLWNNRDRDGGWTHNDLAIAIVRAILNYENHNQPL